jgi:hypothetical protein
MAYVGFEWRKRVRMWVGVVVMVLVLLISRLRGSR